MPELPELEIVRDVLQARLVGKTIERVELIPPGAAIVVRDLTGHGFVETLTGVTIQDITRRGKFILFRLDRPATLVLNPKLTGRLQLASPQEKRHKKTAVIFTLSDGSELRYFDQKTMGQFYLADDVNR